MAMTRGRLGLPHFDVWALAESVVDEANVHDCVWINGSARSIDLEFADPPVLIRSRFRVSRLLEELTRREFEDHALAHFARHAAADPRAERPTSMDIVFDETLLPAPVVLSTIVFASVNLDALGVPEGAVDIALTVFPNEPLRLRRVDRSLVATLLTRLVPPADP